MHSFFSFHGFLFVCLFASFAFIFQFAALVFCFFHLAIIPYGKEPERRRRTSKKYELCRYIKHTLGDLLSIALQKNKAWNQMMTLSDMLFKTPSSTELTGEFNIVYTTKVVLIKQDQIFSITTFFGTDLTYQRLVFLKKKRNYRHFITYQVWKRLIRTTLTSNN